MDKNKTYIAIDLKSFYASVECVERKLNPLTTNLVVADSSRTEKTICLAVSPSLKAYGISGRARLFEVIRRVKEINADRLFYAVKSGAVQKNQDGQYGFAGSSFTAPDLKADPSLELTYITAPPRMKFYEEYSTRIFSIYKRFISDTDIHVYSIDEVFIDATAYLKTYNMTAHELAMTMIREVLYTTGITATVGIGTNLYLAKVAMDIVAKKAPADKDGVRIAELDEQSYREQLWCHTPLADFWRIGRGVSKRLAKLNCFTMGDVARLSIHNEDLLYKDFGVNSELLIDHAWGREPTTISMIKSYQPQSNSLSSGQVLMEPYSFEKGRLIVREMTELMALDLVRKGMVTRQMTLTIGYDRTSLSTASSLSSSASSQQMHRSESSSNRNAVYMITGVNQRYNGKVVRDRYGRAVPVPAHGSGNLDRWTNSAHRIMDVMMDLYDRIVDPELLIRRVTIAAVDLIAEDEVPEEEPEQLDLFTDYEALEKQREYEDSVDQKERDMQKATLKLQEKYGKNVVLKGMNLLEGGTTIQRNSQIGGHRADSPAIRPAEKDSQ